MATAPVFATLVTAAALRSNPLPAVAAAALHSPGPSPDTTAGPPVDERLLPLPPGLSGLLPEGALRRGRTLQITGSTSLLLALLGTASAAGAWCAAVGLPALGAQAAQAAGVELSRFALVPEPEHRWSDVIAALIEAIDLIAVAAPAVTAVSSLAVTRRLSARARERGATLLVVGPWQQADAEFVATAHRWSGLHNGHGYLRHHELAVVSRGRRVGARPREAQLRLGAAGDITTAAPVTTLGHRSAHPLTQAPPPLHSPARHHEQAP